MFVLAAEFAAMVKLPNTPARMTPSFAISFVTRCLQEGLAHREFGAKQILEIVEFFGEPLECVYCGTLEVKRWDHLIAVSNGGETVLGNMVPACAPCDDSKQHKPFDEWLQIRAGAVGLSPDAVSNRVSRIREYQSHFGYRTTSMLERLTDEEKTELAAVQDDAARLKIRIEELIASYRVRTGSK